jgi:uncharacterized protein (DUF952 family)
MAPTFAGAGIRQNEKISVTQLIYKILSAAEWQEAERDGIFKGAGIDLNDGFIHFSTAEQAAETAGKHFAAQAGLVLVAVDAEKLRPALKWEVSRGGQLFPHLYASLPTRDVAWARPLPLGPDGEHVFPI